MPVTYTCPNGHEWSPAPEQSAGPNPCPVCGVAALSPEPEVTGNLGNETVVYGSGPAGGDKRARDPEKPVAVEKVKTSEQPLPQIPGFEVVRELGRGGMGVVYQARQVSLNRSVALKMVLSGAHASAEDLQRFQAEAKVLGRLHHPNLVQVYEVGEYDKRAYFSLEYVDGGDLEDKYAGKPQPPVEVARLMAEVARAVHAAHRCGIIHRDLKPANVLLTADGTPKITDFGLAKQMDSARGATRTGSILGTPSYMAPEQAAGKSRQIGPHTDVWALGAMLYEFLTGRPPFLADTAWDTVLQVVHEEPVPPRKLQPKVSRDLETICLKCLQKDIRKRYQTAEALAEDLERLLRHEPILARPIGPIERTWKWARRRPGAAAMVVSGVVIVLTLLAAGAFYHVHLQHVNEENRRGMVRLSVTQGAQQLENGDWFGALAWFALALEKDRGDAARETMHRERIAATFRGCPRLTQLLSHDDAVKHGSFSHDARLAATACLNDHAYVWEVQSGKRLADVKHDGDVIQAWFSPDREASRLLTASLDGTARLWETGTGRPIAVLRHGAPLECAYYSPDGRSIVTAGGDRFARIWDAQTGKELNPPIQHDKTIYWAVFSPDGSRIATASADRTARVWDVATRKPVTPPLPHDDLVSHVSFSPDGTLLVSSSDDHTARLWRVGPNVSDVQRLVETLRHNDLVKWGVFSPDGTRVLTASDDKTARVWDTKEGRPALPPLEHGSNVRRYAAFSPDGCLIVTASDDNTARVWDAHTGDPFTTNLVHNGTVHALAVGPQGHRILTVSDDETARLWDLATGTLLSSVTAPQKRHGLPLPADDRDWGTGAVTAVVSPDGRRKVMIHHDDVQVVDIATGKPVTPLLKHGERVTSAAFSPDGRWLATGSQDQTARIWDASTGEPRRSTISKEPIIVRHASYVIRVAFSPDGSRLVSAGGDNTARIWIAATGELATQPLYHHGSVNAAVFSPEGRRVATGSNDRSARVWDASTGAPLTPPLTHPFAVVAVAFSSDGRQVVSTGRTGMERTWKLPSENRRPEVIRDLSQLLAGHRINARGEYMPLDRDAQAELWKGLGGRHPELSAATETELREWQHQRCAACEAAGEWFGVRWHLDRMLAEKPTAWDERRRRGHALAELGEWDAALTDYTAVAEHDAGRADVQARFAILQLRAGNKEGYEKTCRQMLDQFGNLRIADALYQTAWACNLSSDASFDRARVAAVAERAVAEDPKDGRYLSVLGAALYRASRLEDAIAKLEQAVKLNPEAPEPRFFLALAQVRLHHAADARQWLQQAHEEQRHVLLRHALPWYRRLAIERVRAEAGKAVESP